MIRLAVALAVAGVFAVGATGLHLNSFGNLIGSKAEAVLPSGSCEKTDEVVSVGFSKTKYAHVRRHARRAIREGWPSVLVVNRRNADERREKALEGVPTKPGFDRDEYPAAVLRKTWHANVTLVPSSENRSHGAVLGVKLRRYCDGTKVKFVWY
jgi:hypothetical protein